MKIILLILLFLATGLLMGESGKNTADLLLINAEVYTMEPAAPWAWGVAIKGNRILAILADDKEVKNYRGQKTRVIDLQGQFVLPGFIDGHVHFDQAGALINDVNLMTIADNEGLRQEMKRVTAIIGKGEWITGGMWGAYEEWSLGADKATAKKKERWQPSRRIIDDLTTENPCLLSSFDEKFFLANTVALNNVGLLSGLIPGIGLDANKKPNGLIQAGSPALQKIQAVIKPKSLQRLLNENRAALKRLAESGIVEIHDIAKPEQIQRFIELQKSGELTCRVWLRPDLSLGEELGGQGLRMGMNPQSKQPDNILRYGALKGYIDGIMGTHSALFFAPYDDQPGNYGNYRSHTSNDKDFKIADMEKMYRLIQKGYKYGFVANVHAIGDKGVALMLDTYERLAKELGKSLDGFRVIHAQVIRPQDFFRFRQLNIVAEVNPYHISDDMRWMEQRIGHERCRGAYAFKSLLENGATLCFGSDWPGTSAAEYHVHPKYLLHAAVNRTTLNGTPKGGWFPEQKISMAEALKAYIINTANATLEGDRRGSLKPGKLADIVVCDRNLLKIEPGEILKMNVVMTIVDGRIVFAMEEPRVRSQRTVAQIE